MWRSTLTHTSVYIPLRSVMSSLCAVHRMFVQLLNLRLIYLSTQYFNMESSRPHHITHFHIVSIKATSINNALQMILLTSCIDVFTIVSQTVNLMVYTRLFYARVHSNGANTENQFCCLREKYRPKQWPQHWVEINLEPALVAFTLKFPLRTIWIMLKYTFASNSISVLENVIYKL